MEILKRLDNGSVLALVNLDRIKCHEDIKEDYLDELFAIIGKDGELFRPILVANPDLVVLDGHHRYHTCKKLGCKRITCILVDYFRDDIEVTSWSPLVLEKEEADLAFETIKSAGFEIQEVETEEEMHKAVDAREAAIGLIVHDGPLDFFIAKSIEQGDNKKTFSEAMKPIVKDMRSRRKLPILKYTADFDKAKQMVVDGTAKMLIKVPVIAKENVIRRSNLEEKYPPKTTKHMLPEIQDYHVSLERLKKSNPEEDVEMTDEQRIKDEQHMKEHMEKETFKASIEYWFNDN
ncbi:MAG: ParB N-terminal domain-containing protein [Candidatus Undinarchaeales archaeon]|jgi:hypothetical protein|nr:ParB N-terminal domain-containing protein [Candidatus Undinarchaeales archaeon]